MDQLILLAWLEQTTGIESASWVFFFTLAVMICNFISRKIPDDATGFLGFLNAVTKLIGLYTSNKVSSGVTVNDVAKATVQEVPKVAKSVIEDRIAESVQPLVSRDPATGKFKRLLPVILVCFLVIPFLSACTTPTKIVNCPNASKVRAAAYATITMIDRACPIPIAYK